MEEMEKTVLELFCELNEIEVPETIEDDIISIVVEGVDDIWIVQMEENEIEIFAPIEGIDLSDPQVLRSLLEANYLGMGTGAGRLGIDPFNDKVSLAQRWTVEQLLSPDAGRGLAAFAAMAAGWRKEGIEALQEHLRTSASDNDPPAEFIVRV